MFGKVLGPMKGFMARVPLPLCASVARPRQLR
jgi:hypothetical protein